MKKIIPLSLLAFCTHLLSYAVDYYPSQDGINGNVDLTDTSIWADSNGNSPDQIEAGDTYYVTNLNNTGISEISLGGNPTFAGNLIVRSDRLLYNSNYSESTLTIATGGSLTMESDGALRVHNTAHLNVDLNSSTFTLDGGKLDLGKKIGNIHISNGFISGSGTIVIGSDDNFTNVGKVHFSGVNFSTFTGTFSITGEYARLELPDISTPSFNLELDKDNIGNGAYLMNNNVSLSSLTVGGIAVDPGIYTRQALINYNNNNWGSYFVTDKEDVIIAVGQSIPEPRHYSLLISLLVLGHMQARRRGPAN